ncbi:MATE family efflux transporter [Heyndrickxia ginsengihumi]|uniref:Transporter n=1 Tax=Heyndrickxia ginsengihumi TaxID=363870 RepID=A0A0A6VEY2_9BACI|nr:MATE family efflux transporter [Heyndrickxia ginsengihumi]KHD86785.1 transporter [Heyndrickxia ginsengihumi]MBE6185058.1 MATE family efflux transporter [Bacillus sp. (in: firmicutes)]MCM3022261.1 MATE family efflux transporter [Heyndrickxia ginsengihumi]NEY18494.1 MATE family efflux transporter [Heyndrickxia ginsengihumi]
MSSQINKYNEQTLFSISWPLFIELSLHMGIGIIATLILSHYSDNAAAGVGVANQLLNMFILVFNVTSIGAVILIGQRLGAGKYKEARHVAHSAFGLNFWFGAIIALMIFIFGGTLLSFFDIHGKVYEYALIFTHICGASLFLESISLALSAVLRSYGYTKESMSVTILMDCISIIGNILAISGIFGLPITGVTGVSWAIVIARLIAVLALLYFIHRRLALRMSIKDLFKINKEDVKGLLAIGIPSAGENFSYQFSQLIITGFIATLGAPSLAARVYINNISMICYLFTLAIASGTQLLIARYIGGKQFERALQRGIKTLKIAMLASFITSLIIALTGSPILDTFTHNPNIIAVGLPILWIIIFTEPGRAMNIVLMSALKSAGDVRFPVVIGIFSMWGFAVCLSYLLGVHFELGLIGVWIAQGVDEWFRGTFATKRWLSRPWSRKTIIKVTA